MTPTIYNNQVVLIYKKAYNDTLPEYNDIIVVHHLQERLIKRVIGLPGDIIQIKEGDIYINNKKLVDEYSNNKVNMLLVDLAGDPLRTWDTNMIIHENTCMKFNILRENQYWVIGDNRSVSWFGIINRQNITGKVVLVE